MDVRELMLICLDCLDRRGAGVDRVGSGIGSRRGSVQLCLDMGLVDEAKAITKVGPQLCSFPYPSQPEPS